MAFWSAIRLHRETLSLSLLERQGFETYAPRTAVERLVRGRVRVFTPLLFPTYAFVLVPDQWHAIAVTPGVHLVCNGHAPAPVVIPDEVVASLRSRENVDGLIELAKPRGDARWRKGDRVRVVGGSLRGLDGLFECESGHDRVCLLLRFFGGDRLVELSVDDVTPPPRRRGPRNPFTRGWP